MKLIQPRKKVGNLPLQVGDHLLLAELAWQLGDLEVEDEQREHDGKDAVGERAQPIGRVGRALVAGAGRHRLARSAATVGIKLTVPEMASPGGTISMPVSVRPAAARLNASMQLVAGSAQKKGWPVGV